MKKSNPTQPYVGALALLGVRLSEWPAILGHPPTARLRQYARKPSDAGPWSAAVLEGLRDASGFRQSNSHEKAIAAACSCLLRQRGDEQPEGDCDADGSWHPKGKDAAAFAPVRLCLTGVLWEVSAKAVCRNVRHCAAVYDANVALTCRFVRVLTSRKPKTG